jgi:filamentous hemagglutinin
VQLPANDAVIEPAKLRDYLLSHQHPDGRGKAMYLARLGYNRADWPHLERDLRAQILTLDARLAGESRWGVKYEILGTLTGPNGRAAVIRSIWIVVHGDARPRLVTLVPWEER